jgi:hypothetical protein
MYARDIIRGRIFLGSSIVVLEFVMVGVLDLKHLTEHKTPVANHFG